jgi:hypothetical protein
MYFADHNGEHIRLAIANNPSGPWAVVPNKILPLTKLAESRFHGHIASPDVHVDPVRKRILLFFHAPAQWDKRYNPFIKSKFKQLTGVAAAHDGINFELVNDHPLSLSYLRTFTWKNTQYGLTARALLYREHPNSWPTQSMPWQERQEPLGSWRHCAVHLDEDHNRLFVFYSRWGDKPERIVASYIDLKKDWNDWQLSPAVTILRPTGTSEGAHLPLQASQKGAAKKPMHQLRDPAILVSQGETWLYYSIAGESGISVARLDENWQQHILQRVARNIIDHPDNDH